MKKRKMFILAIALTIIIGGTIVAVKNKDLFGYQSTKEKQLAYLKKHEEEIKEFMKSLNPKVESVQIYWNETQWEKVGNGTPQGGGDVIRVSGGFNHIKDSSWSVLVYIKDGKNNEEDFIEGIGSGSPLRVGGRGFD